MSTRSARPSLKILCVSPEAVPYAKTGGLGDVCGSLPPALNGVGMDVTTVLPLYRRTREHLDQSLLLTDYLPVEIPSGTHVFRVISSIGPLGQRMLFLDAPELFDREGIYGENGRDYSDNGTRYGLFCKAVLEAVRQLPDVDADLFHIHDWQGSFLPIMRATIYRDDPIVRGKPVVMTIHNLGYQGLCDAWILDQLGLPKDLYHSDYLEYHGRINPLKGGLIFSDAITTVSRRYAREIEHARWGAGLEGVVRTRRRHLVGILNGIDIGVWDPTTDTLIASPYSREDRAGKLACRRALLEELSLMDVPDDRPVVAFVGRMAEQKGIDILIEAMPRIVSRNLCLVYLGTGDPGYEQQFQDAHERWPGVVAGRAEYTEELAHRFIAGSDILVAPSRFEPCGLVQMYALRYGTVPLVRKTGGLADTVTHADEDNLKAQRANGVQFEDYSADSLVHGLDHILQLHRDRETWERLIDHGMQSDFSWEKSARRYTMMFRMVHKERAGKAPILEPFPGKPRVATTKGPYMEWGPPLPARYELDTLTLLAQSPTSLFAYYEVSTRTRDDHQAANETGLHLCVILRDLDRNESLEHDLDVDFGEQWFSVRPDHHYQAELALRVGRGGAIAWSQMSSVVRMPAIAPSPRVHTKWKPVEIPEGYDTPQGLLTNDGAVRGLDFPLEVAGRPSETVDWQEPPQTVPRHARHAEGGPSPTWRRGAFSPFLERDLEAAKSFGFEIPSEHPSSHTLGGSVHPSSLIVGQRSSPERAPKDAPDADPEDER